eukprot:gnl/Ergobibamus_cyprinoides/1627.p1 GENE.gnl/Ergobibamus_cyprinoides/1627~~gnl/Ergobibamus_cyprinoides/1627.p1  ORF type:complete len:162 (-),score=28.62 gnl/Ergobibamus_cyprinoides/1627:128-613(-)
MSQLLSTTGFGSVMASMDFLPLFGVSFYTYWPVILLVFVLASLFNLSTKISRALRLPAFEFDEPEVMTDKDLEVIAQGGRLIHTDRPRVAAHLGPLAAYCPEPAVGVHPDCSQSHTQVCPSTPSHGCPGPVGPLSPLGAAHSSAASAGLAALEASLGISRI